MENNLTTWGIVELFGYSQLAGYLDSQVIAGESFLRIDVPETSDNQGFTKFLGGKAIYSITPTTEEIATIAASRLNSRPVEPWIVPFPPPALPESSEELQF